ncbi:MULTISPECIES: hypothetical protein [unclassified Methanoregula]|uniref:hypothetical protein n=1 Tax=unclassified Methanoregula TaxID=2649730 RepID=UPI0009CB7223|nr:MULTISPECIES: hypothetical protein [unclassified Methanoregula]OPX61963.1 MAG: hypothetical protein A4E33_02560 [Methanoregula sp. PtaB.Bin085]OPY34362.1 MAG: hypothetical protein A4E34_01407 [Methanoregula sp. PtaU1.Bin006]
MRVATALCAILVITATALTGCLGTKTIPEPSPLNPTLLIDYQRSGGIADIDDRLVVFDNGAAIVHSRSISREITLNQSDLQSVIAIFNESRFVSLEGNFTSARGGADLLRYRISYRNKTVITEDTAIPSTLEPVIRELDRYLENGLENPIDLPRYRLTP